MSQYHVTHASLGPSESQRKRHLDRFSIFAQFTAEYKKCRCAYTGMLFPLKLSLRMGRCGPPSNTWFLESLVGSLNSDVLM